MRKLLAALLFLCVASCAPPAYAQCKPTNAAVFISASLEQIASGRVKAVALLDKAASEFADKAELPAVMLAVFFMFENEHRPALVVFIFRDGQGVEMRCAGPASEAAKSLFFEIHGAAS